MGKEKELSSNDKRRRTILYKKSNDELIDIVIRKDDVERRLHKTVDTFKKLQITNDKRIETLKEIIDKSEDIQNSQEKTIAALNATIDNKNKSIATLKEHNKALYNRIKVLEKTINQRNKEARILFTAVVCLIITNIILFFI